MSSLRTADAFESGRRFSPSGGREVMTGNASAVRRLDIPVMVPEMRLQFAGYGMSYTHGIYYWWKKV